MFLLRLLLLGFCFFFCFSVRESLKNPKILDFGILGGLVNRLGLMGCYYFVSLNHISCLCPRLFFFYYKVFSIFSLTQFDGEDRFNNGNVSLGDSTER